MTFQSFQPPGGAFGNNFQNMAPAFKIGGTQHTASDRQSLRVIKFLIHETGTYNTQYRRPYQTCLSGIGLQAIQERLSNVNTFTPAGMGGIANQFLAPSTAPEKMIHIPEGWSERRLRFMLEVEYTELIGSKSRAIVLGYTSHHGISHAGSIDPSMEFYVNSVIAVRERLISTAFGNQFQAEVIDSSHVLSNNNFDGIYTIGAEQWIRPEDVYVIMDRANLQGYNQGETLIDLRNTAGNMAVKSRRSNCNPANYMANVLEGYSRALKDTGTFDVPSENELLAKAREHTRDPVAAKDFFLSAIAQQRGNAIGNTFRFKDLENIDRGTEANTVVVMMSPVERASVHSTGLTADWGGANTGTIVASTLSQAVPGLLMDLGLTQIAFVATNRTLGCQSQVSIVNVTGFSKNMDTTPYCESFVIRLKNEVLRDISYDNQLDYFIEMIVDLLGETRISISIAGEPQTDYVAPSFCDALSAPIATSSTELTTKLASDFDSLVNLIADRNVPYTAGIGSFGGF